VGRNAFENNDPSIEMEEADLDFVKDAPHTVLPPLADGFHYTLSKLPSGREAVIVEEDVPDNSEFDRAFGSQEETRRDQFGRKFTR
jgi:hypothetical protein